MYIFVPCKRQPTSYFKCGKEVHQVDCWLTKVTPKTGGNAGKLTPRLRKMTLEGVQVVEFSPPCYRDWGTPTTPERSNTDSDNDTLVSTSHCSDIGTCMVFFLPHSCSAEIYLILVWYWFNLKICNVTVRCCNIQPGHKCLPMGLSKRCQAMKVTWRKLEPEGAPQRNRIDPRIELDTQEMGASVRKLWNPSGRSPWE